MYLKVKKLKVAYKDIAVIVCGALNRSGKDGDVTLRVVESIKNVLPGAEIIISTWTNMDCTGLNVDRIIQKVDVGGDVDLNGNICNVRRQVESVRNAIKVVDREFVFKIRGDLVIVSDSLIRFFENNKSKGPLFENRIVLTNLFIPNPLKDPTLFHVSDLVMFGHLKDIRDFWGEGQLLDFYGRRSWWKSIFGNFSGYTGFRMLPEQVITLSWLNRRGINYDLKHINDGSYLLLNGWIKILQENFLIVNSSDAGIIFPTRFTKNKFNRSYINGNIMSNSLYKSESYFWQSTRYLIYFFNKYLLCWINRQYLFSMIHLLLWNFFPKFMFMRHRQSNI